MNFGGKLQAAADLLVTRVRAAPRPTLYGAPDADTWSAMKVLAHVTEFVPYWAQQAKNVASGAEGAPFGRTHEDPDRIAAVTNHGEDSLNAATDRLQQAVAAAISIIQSIPAEGWNRRGRHPRRGEMTVAEIVETFMLGHLVEHAQQVDQALEAARPARPDAGDQALPQPR